MEFKKNYETLVKEMQQNHDERIADLLNEIEQLKNRLAAQMQENEDLKRRNQNMKSDLDKLRKMLKAMGRQKKLNIEDVAAKMKMKSNLNMNSHNKKNEDYDKIVLDNYLFHIIKVGNLLVIGKKLQNFE